MSQENVEIAKAGFDAWNAGDMDALRELLHPEVITRAAEGWPEPGPFVGTEANIRELERLREAWDADTAEPISDFIESADHVVVRFIPAPRPCSFPSDRGCAPSRRADIKRSTRSTEEGRRG